MNQISLVMKAIFKIYTTDQEYTGKISFQFDKFQATWCMFNIIIERKMCKQLKLFMHKLKEYCKNYSPLQECCYRYP